VTALRPRATPTGSSHSSESPQTENAMKSLSLTCFCTILLGTMVLAQANPVPMVNNPPIPDATAPGGPGFVLTINGAGFVSGSTVNWNGGALATGFVSGSQLTATVPAANIVTAGTGAVTVANPSPGGGTSNVAYLQVVLPTVTASFSALANAGTIYLSTFATADFNNDGKLDMVSGDGCENPLQTPLFTSNSAMAMALLGLRSSMTCPRLPVR
jgi:hypothetical protein